MKYTYYRTEFRIEWENDEREIVEHESPHKADRLPQWSDSVRIDEFSHTNTRRGVIFRWKTRTRGVFDTVRELNFRKIKSIDLVGQEEITVDG